MGLLMDLLKPRSLSTKTVIEMLLVVTPLSRPLEGLMLLRVSSRNIIKRSTRKLRILKKRLETMIMKLKTFDFFLIQTKNLLIFTYI